MPDDSDDCCPGLASSQYERGPTDKNSSMFPMEKAVCDAIEARCGKATSPQSGMETNPSFPVPFGK